MPSSFAPRCAILGGGMAGMAAARALLDAGLAVRLFDREPELGGNAFVVPLAARDGTVHDVDGGRIDYEREACPHLEALLSALGVERRPCPSEVGFVTAEGRPVYSLGDSGKFTAWQAMPTASELQVEYRAFRHGAARALRALVAGDRGAPRTLGEFLRGQSHTDDFLRLFVVPSARACLAMPGCALAELPLYPLLTAWRQASGLGDAWPDRVVIEGGLRAVAHRFDAWMRGAGGTLSLGADVYGLRREADGVTLRWMEASGPQVASFDAVVAAVRPAELAALVEDATATETRTYRTVTMRRDELVLHRDARMMPRSRGAWSALSLPLHDTDSYRDRQGEGAPRPILWLNRAQDLDVGLPELFLSVNGVGPRPRPERALVVAARFVEHPVVDGGAAAIPTASLPWAAIQGADRLWYCGTYLEAPFHADDAIRVGGKVAMALVEQLRHGVDSQVAG